MHSLLDKLDWMQGLSTQASTVELQDWKSETTGAEDLTSTLHALHHALQGTA